MRLKYLIRLLLIIPFLLLTAEANAQSYGMGFNSHEVDQDKRTSLNLSPVSPLNLGKDFSIDFDLCFEPHKQVYFGYIFRLLADNGNNIDLIYDETQFKIVLGEKLSGISFIIKSEQLYSSWNHFKIRIDGSKKMISLTSGGQTVQSPTKYELGQNYQLFFGINSYRQLRTTDVPPMRLRNIGLSVSNQLAYLWSLDEFEGGTAHEHIRGSDGRVENPVWIKTLHSQWKKINDFNVFGSVSVAFDPKTESLYIVTRDSVIVYPDNVQARKSYRYKAGPVNFLPANQSIYFGGNLYNFDISQRIVARFDFLNQEWTDASKSSEFVGFTQANKFYSSVDSSLYVIGGYGYHLYKNDVQQYKFPTHSWAVLKSAGDFFTPRYLAALGSNFRGDTAYILGGYGSASGKQILNPQNLYDMVRYTAKDHKFKKLFDIKNEGEDFAFANSLIINEREKSYYGLIFPPHKSNTSLQLIKGHLDSPGYKILGGAIPYNFHDTHAFADLFYCANLKKFLAVTLFRDELGKTHVQMYTLLGPPEVLERFRTKAPTSFWFYVLIGLVIIVLLILWFIRSRVTRPAGTEEEKDFSEAHSTEAVIVKLHQEEVEIPLDAGPSLGIKDVNESLVIKPKHGAIHLFGGLQIISAREIDINVHFTPLLKELFLIILTYTIRWKNGVSSDTLNELLWFDKSEQSAKNNRSVNIAKLKMVLELIGNCHISKESGCWKVHFDPQIINVDYYNYLLLVANKNDFNKEKILRLTEITQRGNFLTNIEYEWLDSFKSEISFEVIDIYMHYINSVRLTDDPELLVKLANHILYFDSVHEDALVIKCKALNYLGNHLLAKNALENYKKEYFKIYADAYSRDLNDILNS